MNSKIKFQIENIIELKHHIESWKFQKKENIEKWLVDFEKKPREEMSSYYVEHFRDIKFAHILITIAKNYIDNDKITRSVISALGMMMWRYKLPETEEIYLFMLSNIQRKGVAIYVSFHLPKMKMFEKYPNKWDYFMSIPKIAPKKTSAEYFINLVEENIQSVPLKYKDELIQYFTNKYNETKSEYQKDRYKQILNNLKS